MGADLDGARSCRARESARRCASARITARPRHKHRRREIDMPAALNGDTLVRLVWCARSGSASSACPARKTRLLSALFAKARLRHRRVEIERADCQRLYSLLYRMLGGILFFSLSLPLRNTRVGVSSRRSLGSRWHSRRVTVHHVRASRVYLLATTSTISFFLSLPPSSRRTLTLTWRSTRLSAT